jgi:hypothetical protein
MLPDEVPELPIREAHRLDPVRVHALLRGRAQQDFHGSAAGEVSGGSKRIGLLDEPRHPPRERLVQAQMTSEVRGSGAANSRQRQHID